MPNELPNKKFPIDAQGRSFHENWYWKKLTNGDVSRRKWLSYSKKQNKAYCLYCVLFGRNVQTNWVKEGFNFWKNGPTKILIHETSEDHIMASIKAAYKEASFPLLPSLKENAVSNILINRELIRHLIDLTLFLGRHCLSFRGHKEGWQEEVCGNFKDLAKLIAKYSPALSSYITQLQIKGRKIPNFLSWQRQNQLIQAISTNIRFTIQKELLSPVFFSVSLDTTYDISRKEQLSIVLRYINKKNGIVCERLVAVRDTVLTTGQHLFTMFVDICKEMNLDWKQNLVGQSYDGAASMRGAYNGLQSIVKTHNPSATYVWCWAHRISLVVVDAVSSCVEARDLFGNLETLYDYIGSSKKRGGLYSDYQKMRYPGKSLRRLKRVSTTRWSSHASALQTVFDTYDALIDLLYYLQADSSSDRVCSVKAKSLLDYLLSERFILTGLTFRKIFDLVNPLSKFLQGKNVDLLNAVSYVQFVLKKMQELRNETQFKIIVNEKNIFLDSRSNDFYFLPLTDIRTRRIKKMPGEMASDDQPIISPLDNFKIKTYYTVIDIVCTQVAERFNDRSTPLFRDISLFQQKRLKEVADPNNLRLPIDAFNAFEQVYGKFVSAVNLRREYLQFANTYFEFEKLVKLPEKLHQLDNNFTDVLNSDDNDNQNTDEDSSEEDEKPQDTIHMLFEVCNRSELKNIFPSLYTALCISLTLPVSSASSERAFSKLKLIKTRLRSTMCEERLESLMMISCEKDIPIDTDEVIKCFSSYSPVLLKLLT